MPINWSPIGNLNHIEVYQDLKKGEVTHSWDDQGNSIYYYNDNGKGKTDAYDSKGSSLGSEEGASFLPFSERGPGSGPVDSKSDPPGLEDGKLLNMQA